MNARANAALRLIESIAGPELSSAPVHYRVAHELVSARFAELESQLAQFNEHGIAIGPLSALRSIPFRAIFLLGLNEGQFPERDRHDPMDLGWYAAKPATLLPLSATDICSSKHCSPRAERICLSYVARDAKTGDRLEPSSVVRELKSILRGSWIARRDRD